MISLSIWRATFFATLGVSPLIACSSSSSSHNNQGDAGSGGATGGGAATGGVTGTGGAGTGATGGSATGGKGGTGGISSTGGSGGLDGGDAGNSICKNPTPRLDFNGQPTGFIDCAGGFTHRPTTATCPTHLPRVAQCGAGPVDDAGLHSGLCSKDTDCPGPDGFCQASTGAIASCFCNNGCQSDTDCATGEICGCGDPVGQCIPAACTTDAECGAGFLCISSKDSSGCGYTFGCQTAKDTCVTDADCSFDAGAPFCEFITDHHECSFGHPCGTGRPFLVGGAARVANLGTGADWQSTLRPEFDALENATRSTVAERWTEIALMEHASIAAFARFALELMSLGAPSRLLAATQAAMADETVHARDAFALASAYAGRNLGPGLLDVHHALTLRSPLEVVRTAILEGCIGETVAAVEAAEALAHATDPAVRAALARVSPDETKHAELGWQFVRWVLESGPEQLRAVAAAELLAVVRTERTWSESQTAAYRAGPSEPALLAHGVLDEGTRLELRRRVLAEIIEPCALALVRTAGGAASRTAAPAHSTFA